MKVTTDTMQAFRDAYDRLEAGAEAAQEWIDAKDDTDREAITDAREELDGELEEIEAGIQELYELLPLALRQAEARRLLKLSEPGQRAAAIVKRSSAQPDHEWHRQFMARAEAKERADTERSDRAADILAQPEIRRSLR